MVLERLRMEHLDEVSTLLRDPRVAATGWPGGSVVGPLAHAELSAARTERVDLGNGARADEVARVAVEDVGEDQVEAADETDERCRHGDADRELQPAAETEALHVIL